MQAGQLKVPPGYHPLDVEKEWGKLHVAILEREKQLRSEFERWAGVGRAGGCCSAAQLCLVLCDPVDCSTVGVSPDKMPGPHPLRPL